MSVTRTFRPESEARERRLRVPKVSGVALTGDAGWYFHREKADLTIALHEHGYG
jgi:hypothetical protein